MLNKKYNIKLKNVTSGDLLNILTPYNNHNLIFKDLENGDLYNFAYHCVISEALYLYAYKNSNPSTCNAFINCIEAESSDDSWNHKAILYLEQLAETEYSPDDYRFSLEKIENEDFYDERFDIVTSLNVYACLNDVEDINKIDELSFFGKTIVEAEISDNSVTILVN